MIVFRTDGNINIGLGHVMRCLAVATEAEHQGKICLFAVSDDNCKMLIEQYGFSVLNLHTEYSYLDILENRLVQILEQVEMVFVDTYLCTNRYLSALSAKVKSVYFDDLMKSAYPVNYLINYNIYACGEAYKRIHSNSDTNLPQMLLGPDFAPLRREFRRRNLKEIKPRIATVLVLTGGSDPEHFALNFMRKIIDADIVDRFIFIFVLGMLNADKEAIEKCAFEHSNISVLCNTPDMLSVMQECDLAITAAGSTQYELCACGVPSINYVTADNQIIGANEFDKRGIMSFVGDIRNDDMIYDKIVNLIVGLSENYYARKEMSMNAQRVVDGYGTRRVLDELMC